MNCEDEPMPDLDSPEFATPLVLPPRHPAEELTGCRLQAGDAASPIVHMPLPHEAAPSLSHLAVAVDIAAGQAAARCLPGPHTALRTLALNLQLGAALTPGTWVAAHGHVRAHQGQSILTSCEVFDADGALLGLGTGRFMIVDVPRQPAPTVAPAQLDASVIPPSWDAALGLGVPVLREAAGTQGSVTTQSAAPSPATDNAASMVHGGVQIRALELAMRSALSSNRAASPNAAQGPDPAPGVDGASSVRGLAQGTVLSDVAVVFHRPVPIGSDAGVEARSSVRRRGRRVAVAEASLVGPDHKLLCTAEGIFTAAPSASQ